MTKKDRAEKKRICEQSGTSYKMKQVNLTTIHSTKQQQHTHTQCITYRQQRSKSSYILQSGKTMAGWKTQRGRGVCWVRTAKERHNVK